MFLRFLWSSVPHLLSVVGSLRTTSVKTYLVVKVPPLLLVSAQGTTSVRLKLQYFKGVFNLRKARVLN